MSASERMSRASCFIETQARTAKRLVVDHHEHVGEEPIHGRAERRGFRERAPVVRARGEHALDDGPPPIELAERARPRPARVSRSPERAAPRVSSRIELVVGQLAARCSSRA